MGRSRGHGWAEGSQLCRGYRPALLSKPSSIRNDAASRVGRESLEISATDEGQGGLLGQQHHAEQGDEAAADGVVQVFLPRLAGPWDAGCAAPGERQQGG